MGRYSNELRSMIKPNAEYNALLEATKGLVKKWSGTGLLKGIEDENKLRNMAILLENQGRQLLAESTRVGGDGTEEWSNVALPIVRRIFGNLSVQDCLSIQPMNLPTGLVFYLDFKYGSGNQPGFTLGNSVYGGDYNDDGTTGLFGRTNGINGGFYGAGRFGYSMNDYTSGSLTAAVASASWADVKFYSGLSASAVSDGIRKVSLTLGSDADPDAVRAFKPTSASANVVYLPEYTTVSASGTNYVVTFLVSGSATALVPGTNWAVQYYKMPSADNRGDFEDLTVSGSYSTLDIPEIDLQMKSEPIVAKTRKLKTMWTPEIMQDLNAYHSIDAQAEVTDVIHKLIANEIDLELLEMLLNRASTEEYWSARTGWVWNGSGFAPESFEGTAYTQNTWFQTLGTKINKISNKIHQKTFMGGVNFIQCSPEVATILESIPGYQTDSTGDEEVFGAGITKVGSISKRVTIYKNPYMTRNVMLAGYRGKSFLETGAVYAPYVPLISTPLIWDVNNFTPRLGFITRYGKKVIKPEMYGRIIIHGLDTI